MPRDRSPTVTLPQLLRIQLREHGSVVRQLHEPSWTGTAALRDLDAPRTRGFSLTAAGRPEVIVLANTSQPLTEWTHVLRLRNASRDLIRDGVLDLGSAKWIKHPDMPFSFPDAAAYARNAREAEESWADSFVYKREDGERNLPGLRRPQLGAIHAVQAHWSVDRDPGTVVLPTGVGKTETMLSLLSAERCGRVLVVVPTDALRTQLSDKFLSFGLLKSAAFGVITANAAYPVVGTLNRRPTTVDEVESLFRKCNVIVTTMPLATQCADAVMQRMAQLCPCLFIDEAHHVAAPTWKDFKDAFADSRILQFTATPFRNDDKPIGGKRLFTFSLRHAQEQGYFKQINFKPVTEFDPAKKDSAIAAAAVAQLREDHARGHILMARVSSVARAEEVFECYRPYAEFNPVQMHTGVTSKTVRDENRRKLLSGESRIVVCVDMLGEGFDLPELKIAAFHDIRKTLAVTLQLAGRFTRTKPHLGNATFIANIADLEVKDELRRLYQHDSDWNVLLPLISEGVAQGEFSLWDFLGGFQELPDELTLRNVKPAMSTVVYRTQCTEWTPDNYAAGIPGFADLDKVYHTINPQEHTLVIVTAKRVPVDWAQIDDIHNWDWQLYVLHWQHERGLLYIHNSSNAGFFKKLAEAVAGNVTQVSGPNIFRCLAGINRLKLQNVGLLEQLGRLIRYTMRAGSDVESGLSEAQRQRAIKANLFGQGFEDGHRTTIGCSYKGRIWSYKKTNLLQLTTWCRAIGERLTDASLDPEEVLRGTLVPELVSARPAHVPISVEWPDIFYREPEQTFSFQINGVSVYRHDVDLVLLDPSDTGDLRFAVASEQTAAGLALSLFQTRGAPDFGIHSTDAANATILHRGRSTPLHEFFTEEPPTFWFADGSSLTGIEYVALRQPPEPFPRERIDAWDWSGTDIRVESQGIERNPLSIQHRVISELRRRQFSVLFDDDDQGESADVVGVRENDDHIEVEFWHCKFSLDSTPGHRIKDLYELCGQAQKSIRWLEKPRDLFTHLMRREPRRRQTREATRYEVGSIVDLMRIREKATSQRLRLQVFIVQPGLSKAAATRQQLELLAVTEKYLLETFAVPFGVVSSS